MRRLTALATATLLLAALSPMAAAGAGPAESVDDYVSYFYFGDGYLVMTGDDVAAWCADEGAEVQMTLPNPRNGAIHQHFRGSVPLMLFSVPNLTDDIGEAFAYLDMVCGAALDDDPATVPPEPVARGTGRLSGSLVFNEDGTTRSHNSLSGKIWTDDGVEHITAVVNIVLSATGMPIKVNTIKFRYSG